MKLKELLKKIDNREMLNIYNKEKDCIGRMGPENARKYLSILLLESEVDVIRTCGEEIEIYMKEDEPQRAVPEFLTKRMNLPVGGEEETGWEKQMYNKFMKGAGR
nr:MAG TPA: hypothetical protein [Caudoviricetes sp.]